jgi:diphosphomevalonate decarboxylase
MSIRTATAFANANIAFIKYWGNCNPESRVPANGSISMNLGGLYTRTQVTFDPALAADALFLDRKPVTGPLLQRVSDFLDQVRRLAGTQQPARVESANNFPMGAGIASSASAFAALALAATAAAGLYLPERELSRLARLGSGSACRSVPGGFVEWQVSECDEDSYAFSIATPDHWKLSDCIALVSQSHKFTGSTEGHALAGTSPLQAARVVGAPQRLDLCRRAILERDFSALAEVVELDSNLMHAVMMTSSPPLFYWQPATIEILRQVPAWRKEGLPACYTVDAGPNVHVICPAEYMQQVQQRLSGIPGVTSLMTALPGASAHLVESFE